MVVKTQFEIRYTEILDFEYIYKEIFSPYLKFATANISNRGTYEEFIVLTFTDESTFIDCRKDRIIFVFDDKRENVFNPNGLTFNFFSILKTLTEQKSFGKITNVIFGEWSIFESKGSQSEIRSRFRERYLLNLPVISDYKVDDLSVISNYKFDSKIINIAFGPYNPEHDINKYNLRPPKVKQNFDLQEKNGLLIAAVASTAAISADVTTFKRLSRTLNELTKQISI
ncbi:hypothetical protein BH23BAC1_BH23BAC1_20490 [soil metagenome]